MPLDFIPPQIIDGKLMIILEEEEIKEIDQNWSNAFVIDNKGDTPNYTFISNYVANNWKGVTLSELYLHGEGFYIA